MIHTMWTIVDNKTILFQIKNISKLSKIEENIYKLKIKF